MTKAFFNFCLFSFLGIAILSGESCGTYYYAASKQNVMKFKEKGDVSASVGVASEGGSGLQNLSLGYAFTKHWAFISSYNKFTYLKEGDYVWDNEVVFYHKLNKNVLVSNNFGFSAGKLNTDGEYFNLNIYREFLQPSIGFSNDFVELALSLRFANLHYNLNQVKSFDLGNGSQLQEFNTLGDIGSKNYMFMEPALTFGLGYKAIKLRTQIAWASQLDNDYLSYHQEAILYLSLNARFNISDVFNKGKN